MRALLDAKTPSNTTDASIKSLVSELAQLQVSNPIQKVIWEEFSLQNDSIAVFLNHVLLLSMQI
jgi:hypothetical protein